MAEKNSQEFVIATRDATDESQGMVNKGAIMRALTNNHVIIVLVVIGK